MLAANALVFNNNNTRCLSGSDSYHTATYITTAGERTQALLSFYEPWLTAESGDGSEVNFVFHAFQ